MKFEDSLKILWQRIEKLEQNYSGLFYDTDHLDEQLKKLIERIEKLEKELQFQMEVFKTNFAAIKHIESKKPHVCPVCYGSQEFELESIEAVIKNDGKKIIACKPCDGKGVIWG